MEPYQKLKKETRYGLVITDFLIIAVLVNDVITLGTQLKAGNVIFGLFALLDFAMCALIMLYASFGYKKPHGNMLKGVLFAYSVFLALNGTLNIAADQSYLKGDLAIFAALLAAYVSGRLNKIEKNKIILTIIGLLLFARVGVIMVTVPNPAGVSSFLGRLAPVIIHAALSLGYVARYEEHKAAGLADAQ